MIHDTIKQRLRASLLLTPPPKTVHALALRHAADLRPDGSWSDVPEAASSITVHLERTLLLARASRPAAGALDDPLRRAFDFWLANDFTFRNWHLDQIVVPRLVGEIALLYDPGLSAGAAGKVMEILARSRWANWVPTMGWVEHTGTALLSVAYNQVLRGCLENAPSLFDAAFGRIFREIRPVDPGVGGIQPDLSFQLPPGDAASGGGGFAFTREFAQLAALAHGTPWQAPAETVKVFAAFLLDGQQWMIHRGTVDTDTPDDVFSVPANLENLAAVVQQLAQLGNPPRRQELAAFAHRLQGRGDSLSGHRYFWRARMAVHQRPSFYASLRLAPPSAPAADGQLYVLRAGDEYQGVSPAAGSGQSAVAEADNSGQTLAGGVSEGDYGMTVTDLRQPGLSGRKAWFFFDESLVCLGTGLSGSGADAPASTTINHCRWRGDVIIQSTVGDARVLEPDQEHALSSVRSVSHDGLNYIFPQAAALSVDPGASGFCLRVEHGRQPRGASFQCIILPTDDDPETPARLDDEISSLVILANTPALQAVHHRGLGLIGAAFWEPGVVTLPGAGRIAANHPCLLLCRNTPDGDTRLSIANPGSQAAVVHVEFGGQCVCFELPGGADAGRSVSRLF